MMLQKRVAAIHDISCFGKCSLTVALPVLSAAGFETPVIPTAVLSTHTGGFSGYTFRDLTEDILPVAEHWKKENIQVDAVYTGYLGSKEQVGLVKSAISLIQTPNTKIFVDPVMADNGKLYGGFPNDFPKEMLQLCKMADMITPNITEACFMLGIPYRDGPYTKAYIDDLIHQLAEITHGLIVLTGVWFEETKI
ncbi:MAG: bifunctional hydroxymethylpyrimidine kinase/phosphomethylpyrimidine kinase, partial [Clostridia bacterium]|nr:bifunctional hydroxymethylpyrimidine kinase/phosphomethylpyrimidine kinase [Clostridia bacterium]